MTEVVSSQSGTDSDAPEGFSEILGQSRPYYGINPAGRKASQGKKDPIQENTPKVSI